MLRVQPADQAFRGVQLTGLDQVEHVEHTRRGQTRHSVIRGPIPTTTVCTRTPRASAPARMPAFRAVNVTNMPVSAPSKPKTMPARDHSTATIAVTTARAKYIPERTVRTR